MALEGFPLPEVSEALSPYIKPRDEVSAIRKELHLHLQSQVKSDAIPLSSVNLTTRTTSTSKSPPASVSDIRRAYLKALQAHNAAQAEYDTLRADLDRLKHPNAKSRNNGSHSCTTIGEDYIPLLRQREKQRKLKAIETAYAGIASAGGELPITAQDDILKKRLGEPPIPPSTQPSLSRSSDVEAKILELKKALISTKRRVDERQGNALSHDVNGGSAVSPQMEIAGLQNALQELTAWMESQLTIIANAESTAESEESPTKSGAPDETANSNSDIEALYQRYIEARERLVQTINDPTKPSVDQVDGLVNEALNSKDVNPPSKSSVEVLLAYLPTLLSAKQEEQALMQQSAYVRRHITSAETATERLLHRLADESHLVQPGASSGENWATAAREASDATRDYVKARVEVGESSINSADQALENIKSLPASLDRLLPST